MIELERIVGAPPLERGATVGDRVLTGRAAALVHPGDADEVAAVVAWCYAHDVAIVPVGGGSGLAGGAAPLSDDAVAIALDRLRAVRCFDPTLWRMEAQAGVTTATIARLARENGLLFAPDPGAPEDSQLGGMIATNAGGPHAFKYGVTGDWVTGIEAVLAPGEIVRFGGPLRKDVAGYDLRALLTGSEGTLGVVTGGVAALRSGARGATAPRRELPDSAAESQPCSGCSKAASSPRRWTTSTPRRWTPRAARFPSADSPGSCVLAEADGSAAEAERERSDLAEALTDGATTVLHDAAAFCGAGATASRCAVTAARGAKLSEDIAVPLDRLGEAIDETLAIGARHDLDACSWGHAGDGNVHATFLLDPGDDAQRARADSAAGELFDLAVRLGGSVTGEHGIGVTKAGRLSRQWSPAAVAAHRAIKAALDPKGLFNPGKKAPWNATGRPVGRPIPTAAPTADQVRPPTNTAPWK